MCPQHPKCKLSLTGMKSYNMYEILQILSPFFKVSKTWLGDVVKSRILDEMTETLQDFINQFSDFLPKIVPPPPETRTKKPRLFKHYLSLNQENITAVLLFLQ